MLIVQNASVRSSNERNAEKHALLFRSSASFLVAFLVERRSTSGNQFVGENGRDKSKCALPKISSGPGALAHTFPNSRPAP